MLMRSTCSETFFYNFYCSRQNHRTSKGTDNKYRNGFAVTWQIFLKEELASFASRLSIYPPERAESLSNGLCRISCSLARKLYLDPLSMLIWKLCQQSMNSMLLGDGPRVINLRESVKVMLVSLERGQLFLIRLELLTPIDPSDKGR
jgi:hypothetical protein